MKRDHWQRHVERLDPEVDFAEIYRVMATHEFPWDMTQSLGLALYRTYAVPSIGGLLAETGEFDPMRWMDRFGWRPMCETERVASANYYRELGRHMNIKDAPATLPLRPLLRRSTIALLDPPLRDAFRYPDPGAATRALTVAGLRARAAIERRIVRSIQGRSDETLGHHHRQARRRRSGGA